MSFVLAVLLRGAAVSFVGLLLLGLLRRASAATRHAACAVCLGAMLALPLGLAYLPKREVAVERIPLSAVAAVRESAPAVSRPAASTRGDGLAQVATASLPRFSPAEALFVVWAVGALGIGLRLAVGWVCACRLVRRSRVMKGHPHPTLPQGGGHALKIGYCGLTIAPFNGLYSPPERRGVPEIRVSAETSVPIATWVGRAVILLPESHVEWSEERRAAVLLHETAHVERGDWAFLVLSRLALAFHWPNPFAWILARGARRAAEDAADDAVLRKGFAPADYADHLLSIAQGTTARRVTIPALALSMAQRPDVYRRIHTVLQTRRSRGSVSVATLVVASLFVGGVFVPAVSLVAGQRTPFSRFRAMFDGVADPQSYAYDVRHGMTKPGTASNGFTGRLADGSTAQVVQVSMATPKGVVAWRPDGSPIPKDQIRPVEHLGGHYRSILVRYPKRTARPEGGLGSGPRSTGEPGLLGYNSSRDQAGPKPGEWESYQFIEVPREDGDRASFTFSVTNEPWQRFTLTNKAWQQLDHMAGIPSGELQNVVVSQRTATPMLRGKDGAILKDAQGRPVLGKVPSTAISFVIPQDGKSYVVRVTANLRSGKTVKQFWSDQGGDEEHPRYRLYFREAPEWIKSFQIETRGYRHVEFLGVRLKPR